MTGITIVLVLGCIKKRNISDWDGRLQVQRRFLSIMITIEGLLSNFHPNATPVGSAKKYVVAVVGRDILIPPSKAGEGLLWTDCDGLRFYCEQRLHIGTVSGVDCEAWYVDELAVADGQFECIGLRRLLSDEAAFTLAGRAVQMLEWKRDHSHCGRCGGVTSASSIDHSMYCEPCDLACYPRVSPCIITVVTRGDHCLLGRNKSWPEGYYSALAGFVEAGESAEQALHREVQEEVGLQIVNGRYCGSQSWPFPGQLMLGFLCDWAEGEIVVDENELEDARWFSYDQLPPCPDSSTQSGRLIAQFVEEVKERLSSA